jgi:hypothetical protein
MLATTPMSIRRHSMELFSSKIFAGLRSPVARSKWFTFVSAAQISMTCFLTAKALAVHP